MVKPNTPKQQTKKISLEEPRSTRSKAVTEEQATRRMSPRKKASVDESSAVVKPTKAKRKMPKDKAEERKRKKSKLSVQEAGSGSEGKEKSEESEKSKESEEREETEESEKSKESEESENKKAKVKGDAQQNQDDQEEVEVNLSSEEGWWVADTLEKDLSKGRDNKVRRRLDEIDDCPSFDLNIDLGTQIIEWTPPKKSSMMVKEGEESTAGNNKFKNIAEIGKESVSKLSADMRQFESPHVSPPKRVASKKGNKGSSPVPTSLVKRIKNNPRVRRRTEKGGGSEVQVIDLEMITLKKEPHVKLSDWRKGGLWPYVQQTEKSLMEEFMKYGWTSLDVWNKDQQHCLRAKDLDELMMNRGCDSQIIDWFEDHLMFSSTNLDREVLFLSSLLFTLIRQKRSQKTIEVNLDKRMEEHLIKDHTSKLCVPLNTPYRDDSFEGHHWTLLVYDFEENEWTHFNSLYRDMELANRCNYNSKKLARILAEKMIKMKAGRGKIDKKIPYIKDVECPQQGESPDCGLYVMLKMKEIFQESIQHNYPVKCSQKEAYEDEARRLRAEVTYLILDESKDEWRNQIAEEN